MMIKRRYLSRMAVLIFLAFICGPRAFADQVKPEKGNEAIVLVYKTTLQIDIHQKKSSSGQWRYYQDTNRFYNLVEFDPETRTYGKEYVIHYYGKENKVQKLSEGLQYEELDKYNKPNQRYVKATDFGNSSKTTGDVRMKYGIVNLKAPLSVGYEGGKVAVATKLSDKIVYRDYNDWKNFSDKSPSCIFQKRYTRDINEQGLSLEEAVEYMSKILVDRGYQPQLSVKGR